MPDPVTGSNPDKRRTRRRWRRRVIPALAAALLACLPAFSGSAGQPSTEYRIKAAFLYNFTSFVTWPGDTADASGFTLCVLGEDPFGKLLDKLSGKQVNGPPLVIRRLKNLTRLDQCKLVFISTASGNQVGDALGLLQELPVLTVSDVRGFANLGGMIEFRIIANRVRFDINVNAAESAGLIISSKLLSLATRFRQGD